MDYTIASVYRRSIFSGKRTMHVIGNLIDPAHAFVIPPPTSVGIRADVDAAIARYGRPVAATASGFALSAGGYMQKRLARSTTIVCVMMMVYGCSRSGSPTAPVVMTPQSAAVQAIEIAGGSVSGPFVIGRTMQLRAVARLIDGSERDVTSLASWTSENPAVASVDASGLVTARSRGAGRVRAVYQNAIGETAFSVVEGAEPPNSPPSTPPDGGSSQPPNPGSGSGTGSGTPPTVQRLTITGDNTVPVGRSAQFRAIAHMSDGSQKDVTSDADWRSDNSLIGSISQSGVFTGVTPGANGVSANYNGTSASQPVQVTPF